MKVARTWNYVKYTWILGWWWQRWNSFHWGCPPYHFCIFFNIVQKAPLLPAKGFRLFEFWIQILDFWPFSFWCLFWSFWADQNTRGRWWTMKMEKFPFCPLNSPSADKELSLPCLRPNWITMFNRQLISLKTSLFPIGRFPTRGKRRSGRTSFILGGGVGDRGKSHFNVEINEIFSCTKKWTLLE